MRILGRMVLWSLLAAGVGLAGCGETDCPPDITPAASCSSPGLMCTTATATCSCDGSKWTCGSVDDLPIHIERDLSIRDMTPATD